MSLQPADESLSLQPALLLQAYAIGIFPMAMDSGELGWFRPDPRGIIPLDTFHIPKSLQRTLRKNDYTVRINTVFEKVIAACAQRDETWIDTRILASYTELHRQGHAHSVEVWSGAEELVGGLYGVALGGAFFGESMFSTRRDGSKIALVHLVERMRERGYTLLDIQWTTPHLCRFGAREISNAKYLEMLSSALKKNVTFF